MPAQRLEARIGQKQHGRISGRGNEDQGIGFCQGTSSEGGLRPSLRA